MPWREGAPRVPHGRRNPPTPTRLSTERRQKKFAPSLGDAPAFSECTQTILSEVGSLKALVEEFTRFARMPVPAFQEGNLAEELTPGVETFRTPHPGIQWQVGGNGGVPP